MNYVYLHALLYSEVSINAYEAPKYAIEVIHNLEPVIRLAK